MKNKLSQGNRILLMIIAIGLVCLVGIALAYKGIVSPSNSNEDGDEQGGNDTPVIQVPSFLSNLPAKETEDQWQGEDGTFVLRSVGDVLIHSEVTATADTTAEVFADQTASLQDAGALTGDNLIAHGSNNGDMAVDLGVSDYNFDPMVAKIAPFTSYADYTVANLEIPAAYPELPVATYPNFNMPSSILGSLKRAGIDGVSTATNHTLDQFADGANITMDYLDEAGLMYYGAFRSQEDHDTARIVEKNGIKLGFLAYTYGTNGMVPPEDEPWAVNYADLPVMLQEVAALNNQVDAVVVSLHLGTEYGTLPDDEQIAVTQALADAGVKLVIGGHPHDLQPVNWLNDKDTYVIYSQASFMTGQVADDNKVGGIHEVTFTRDENGEVQVRAGKFMPTYFSGTANETSYESVPLGDYKGQDNDQAAWVETIHDRMMTYTEDFTYQDYLETAWTQGVNYE